MFTVKWRCLASEQEAFANSNFGLPSASAPAPSLLSGGARAIAPEADPTYAYIRIHAYRDT